MSLGRILREGSGHRNDSFRYWLPGAEERWATDPDWLNDQRLLERLNER